MKSYQRSLADRLHFTPIGVCIGHGRFANCVLGQVSLIAPCTIAFLCFASPGSATPDGLAFGAADVAGSGGLTGGISAIDAAAVPEPASLLLLGGGLLAAGARRRKTRRGLGIE